MVDKKKAVREREPATSPLNQSGGRARFQSDVARSQDGQDPQASQLRRRFANDGVISGFESAVRPPRRATHPNAPASRSTKEYGDLTKVREEVQPPRRADSRSEEPAVRDFVPEAEVGQGGVATPRPKLPLGSIPRKKMGAAQLLALPLDHRAGFVLAHIDGKTSMRTLLDVCGMSHDEIKDVLEHLVKLRAIDLA